MIPTVLRYDNPEAAHALAMALEVGQTIIFPTDTVYGIGGNPWDQRPLSHVCRLKDRSPDQPFTLHLPNVEMIDRYAILDERVRALVHQLLPGPYTLLLTATQEAPPSAVLEGKTGIRVPDHPLFHKVLQQPVFGTSVNVHNAPPLNSVQEIIEQFNTIDLLITGPVQGTPSAILDLTESPARLIRGTLSAAAQHLLEQE